MRICIVPALAGKAWNGATIYNDALGGSEAAVVYIARGLARAGADVHVLCSGEPGKFDGVQYYHASQFADLLRQAWDVLIVSRWSEVLQHPWQAEYRVFWVHDLPQQMGLQLACNKVFCISQFQAKMWGFGAEWIYPTSDGVDTTVFTPNNGPRDTNKLVWISNPDRGLSGAARIFQEIRKRWPDLELHVYGRAAVYGWAGEAERYYLPLPEHSEHVFLHEPLNKIQLANVLKDAWAMFYPSFWPETCCMAALEAQACGTPVIACPIGALPETVQGGILTYDFNNAISQLRNVGRWAKLSASGIQFTSDFSWDTIARRWLDFFTTATRRDVSERAGAENQLSAVVG